MRSKKPVAVDLARLRRWRFDEEIVWTQAVTALEIAEWVVPFTATSSDLSGNVRTPFLLLVYFDSRPERDARKSCL
jgi:hypothetical protein